MPPPNGNPQNIAAAVIVRRSGRLISEATAIMFGSAAPKPRPTRKRTANSDTKFPANAVASVKMPNTDTAPMNTGLRPIRSARRPPNAAPMTMPIFTIENIQPI